MIVLEFDPNIALLLVLAIRVIILEVEKDTSKFDVLDLAFTVFGFVGMCQAIGVILK
ncbi:MAG: hypothetical protein ACRCXX_13975 [Cetobacterium sp.]|uniref:hypothetical protein n=1 Tax=Cetobacterium sp. TaxID=2071632 RepID=UPI003F3B475F